MSKDVIGALRVTLGFDTSQFEHGSEKAKSVIKRDAAVIRKEVSGARAAITGLAGAFIGVEAVQAAKRALDYAGSLKGVATEAGVSRRELQEYRYVASQASLTQEEMDGTLKGLTKTIGEAKAGTKEQATLFRDLGVSVQDANGRIYSAGEVLPRLADALARIKDPATRARLEVKLFGEDGQKLDGLLTQGSRGIETMRQRARDLGLVLSDDLADGAGRANKQLAEIKQTLDVRFAAAIARNAGAVQGLASALVALTAASLQFINEYPRLSGALAGAWLGKSFGPAGIAIGAGLGAMAGDYAARQSADQNMDMVYRKRALSEAQAQRDALQKSSKDDSWLSGLFTIRRTGDPNIQGGTLESAKAEVERQKLLYAQAAVYNKALAQTQPSTVPAGALPIPDAGGSRRQPKAPKDRTEERAQRFRDELAGLYDDELGMQRDLATDLRERARIEHERIATAKEAYDRDVDSRVKQGELTQAQADALKLQRERNYDREKQQINWSLDDALAAEETRTAREGLDRERDMLAIRAGLATTAGERRAIQLELLDKDLAIARLAADEVLARHDSTEAERKIAQAKIDQLDQLRQGETLRVNRDTMGPLETYLDSIPDTVDEINEAYENLAVTGLRSFNDGLATSAANVLRLKGVAGQLFNQLIADLIRFQIQQAMGGSGGFFGSLFKLGGSLLGLGGGNPLAGSLDVASSNIAGMAANLDQRVLSGFSFAGGGDMTILGRRGIDRNVLSLNGLPIANVSYGERISIANDNPSPRMGSVVYVMPSPYFDARVDQRAYGVAAPIGMQAATAGSSGAQVAITRAGARQIP